MKMVIIATSRITVMSSTMINVGTNYQARAKPFFFGSSHVPRLRATTLRPIRCTVEDGKNEVRPGSPESVTTPPPSTISQSTTPPPPPPFPKPQPKASIKLTDVLAFSGPGPERINGRLAMVGFVAAVAVEVANGQDIFSQVSNGGLTWFVGTSIVLSLASLIPLFKGVSVESKSNGFMSSDAELWNGRFAMLGLVALALTEYVKGGALV